MNFIDPSPDHWALFKSLPRDTPIHMLNLIRYREQAAFPEGHEHAGKGWSGARAYKEYGKISDPIFTRLGGRVVWRGSWEAMVTGPDDKHWPLAFVAEYPSASAFLAMVTDPAYRLAVVNRTAAVDDSRLIRFAPLPLGGGFA